MCVCVWLAMGGEHDKRVYPYLAYYVGAIQPANAALS